MRCDAPGVFTCLRRLGERTSVVAINFSREPIRAKLAWPGGRASVALRPLDYAVVPRPKDPGGAPAGRAQAAPSKPAHGTGDAVAFGGATQWFVDTVEGRLHDAFIPRRSAARPGGRSSIYWRPQGTEAIWRNETAPLHLTCGRVGAKSADGTWTVVQLDAPAPPALRLVETSAGKAGLHLVGLGTVPYRRHTCAQPPPAPDVTKDVDLGGVRFRCVGPDYIVSTRHYTVVLRRQGGAVRELRLGGRVAAKDHDLYGDQAYFALGQASRIQAACDVECGIRLWRAADGLHLRFEGQLRGFQRFALKRPPLWYRNEYVFSDAPRFTQTWAFRTEKSFRDKQAFLASFLLLPEADRFRFSRGAKLLAEGDVTAQPGGARQGQTKGGPAPGRVDFLRAGRRLWGLGQLRTPGGCDCNVFVHGRMFFLTLLDGKGAAMDAGRWYEFQAVWETREAARDGQPASSEG